MKPVFAVQCTGRDDTEIALTVEALDNLGFEWIDFGLIYFTTDITNLEAFPTDRIVIPLAGTKLLSLYEEGITPRNWKIWYDPLLMDQHYQYMGRYMLNSYVEFSTFKSGGDRTFEDLCFVKPTDDGKAFAGAVLQIGESLNEHLKLVTHQEIHPEQKILFAPVQDIDREFRCVVIDNQVVDISEYRSRAGIKAKLVDAETRASIEEFIDGLGEDVRLACVDVCEVLDVDGSVKDLKIVEINCFHCSGMYLVDRARVFEALVNAIMENRV